MNHKPTMLAVTAIVAAMAVTGIAAMATPVFAWGHHHNHDNGIKVHQSINQLNVCSGQPQEVVTLAAAQQQSPTVCLNTGSNNADIDR
ncbi:MAG TPA: hypothetical protein VJR67_03070 [Candidatus Nitrosopolaris sp.]|nr:hypothetical protein [Candidatus Nitrosopolaris sp.]